MPAPDTLGGMPASWAGMSTSGDAVRSLGYHPPVSIKHKTCRRFNDPGHAHELTFTCFRGLPLLSRDRSRLWLIDAIARARERHAFDLWAYVIMPEHVHLIVCPRRDDYDVSRILTAIKWPVSRWALDYLRSHAPSWIERLTDRQPNGRPAVRFWQRGGGYDRNIRSERTLYDMIRYVHDNPVRRGLVAQAADWRWSNAAWYDGERNVPLTINDESLPMIVLNGTGRRARL